MKKKTVEELAMELAKIIEAWDNPRPTKAERALEDMIRTIERNAVNNQVTIHNVEMFAREWRMEGGLDIKLR